MIDQSKLRKQQERGNQARELLENPILDEAFAKIEKYLRDSWEISKGGETERREDIWRSLKLLEGIKQEIKLIAANGKEAQRKLLEINQ